jgi:hypothetical protein
MSPYISGKPSFHIKSIFTKPKKQNSIFPLNQKGTFFFFSVRYALAAAIEALSLQPGDKILVPSYNCGVEINPISHCGIEQVFYKIDKDLLVDFDDLHSKISSGVKAILITHYLGFPQPVDQIKKICVERNLLLFEDCAHAFLSGHMGRPLGSYGDAAFFSLLKTLPVPNGGALVLNREDLSFSAHQRAPSTLSTFLYAAELLNLGTWGGSPTIKQMLSRILRKGIYLTSKCAWLLIAAFRKLFDLATPYLARPDSYLFIGDLRSWGISRLSENIINGTDFEKIKSIRRRNFEYLLNHFLRNDRGILPFKELPPDVSLLFFPIILESKKKTATV